MTIILDLLMNCSSDNNNSNDNVEVYTNLEPI